MTWENLVEVVPQIFNIVKAEPLIAALMHSFYWIRRPKFGGESGIRRRILAGLVLTLLLAVLVMHSYFPLVQAATEELAYDDGTPEGGYSWHFVGYKMAVRFTPSVSGLLRRCAFYIYSEPAPVKIHVMDSGRTDIITFTYDVTDTWWINVNLLAYDFEVSAGVDFYIGLEWTVADAPVLGYDESSPDGRSWDGTSSGGWSQWNDNDYMIRATVGDEGEADIDVNPVNLDFDGSSSSSPASGVTEISSLSGDRAVLPIMRVDDATFKEWDRLYNSAPLALVDSEFIPETSSFSLLDHLEYVPSERDQGQCGNCWVWAGTGVMEVALDVQEGIRDRLSVQYLTSWWHGGVFPPDWAGYGGSLAQFADWYQDNMFTIPWSNTNGYWQDGNHPKADGTIVPGSTISNSPNYPMTSCVAETIATQGVGQAQAISNIKSVLGQNKAIYFSFDLPNDADWDVMQDFWYDESESAVWSPDYSNGHTWGEGHGGHAVLCVGYDETDPDNSYWIMVNSWGTAYGGRPNGIFRVDMDMNYDCWLNEHGYSLEWQTLDIDFDLESQPVVISNVGNDILEVSSIEFDQPWLSISQPCPPAFEVAPGERARSHTVLVHADKSGLSAGVYYGNMDIYSNDPDESPATVTITLYVEGDNTCLVVRGSDDRIYYRTYDSVGESWGEWKGFPDGWTVDAPAATVCDGRLYVVVRGMDGSSLWFSSVSLEDDSFSGWTQLSGASDTTPTLTSSDTAVILTVKGMDSMIYYRVYDTASETWDEWNALPDGWTLDVPAATVLSDQLHFAVRGMDGSTLWHSSINLASEVFGGWELLPGASDATPTLASSEDSGKICLVVKGMDNMIYYNVLAGAVWGGWQVLPEGWTSVSPSAVMAGSVLQVVVQGMDGSQIWHSNIDLDSSLFSGWTLLSGSTPSRPILAS